MTGLTRWEPFKTSWDPFRQIEDIEKRLSTMLGRPLAVREGGERGNDSGRMVPSRRYHGR